MPSVWACNLCAIWFKTSFDITRMTLTLHFKPLLFNESLYFSNTIPKVDIVTYICISYVFVRLIKLYNDFFSIIEVCLKNLYPYIYIYNNVQVPVYIKKTLYVNSAYIFNRYHWVIFYLHIESICSTLGTDLQLLNFIAYPIASSG